MFEKTIVEVNGIKLEVSLTTDKRIDEYKIGDNVKILMKRYSGVFDSYPGIIVGFDNFKNLPSIIICYFLHYSDEVKFTTFNAQSKDTEICHMAEHEEILDRVRAVDVLNREIEKKLQQAEGLKRKRNYFVSKYNPSLCAEFKKGLNR